MKKLVTIIALVVVAQVGKGQEGYVSNDNYTGDWSSSSSWTKSAPWLGDVPPNPVNGSTAYVDIYGTINHGSGLTVSGGSTLTIYDTLIVNGNLVLSGGGNVVIENGGILVILGGYDGSGGTVTSNGGRAVVTGDLSIVGGADVVNNATGTDAFYLYGTPSRSGGAKFNGSNDPAASNFRNESELQSNDPSLYSLVNAGVLPVEFVYARAQVVNNDVQVTWATASELNNDFFVVERSTDGVNYTAIQQVDGAGNSEELLTYDIMDSQVISGTYFYRVKQVDFDGQFDYSEIARVTLESNEPFDVKAYPNPTNGPITLDFFAAQDAAVKVVVRSLQGEVKQVVESTGLSLGLDLSSFPKGYYFIEVYQGQQKKIVKVILN